MSEKVQNLFAPDQDTIKKHLDFIRLGMEDYDDGRIEVGGLFSRNTENFGMDETEKAAAFAASLNVPGQNAYLVGAFLDPDMCPTGRSSDDNFYASSVVWADIDDPHDADALKALYASCPPNRAIVTSRHPTRRIQLWWKLREPLQDSDTLREALVGICQALGGDSKVINPTSLMRLGGTINYPNEKKLAKGRVIEKTEYAEIHDNRYDINQILAAYPVKDYSGVAAAMPDPEYVYKKTGILGPELIADGRETYMHKMVFASIVNLTAEHERWPEPQEVFDDVWPVYSARVATSGGRSLEQDGRGQKALIQKIQSKLRLFKSGGMARHKCASVEDIIKNNKQTKKDLPPGVDPETGEYINTGVIKATSINDIDLDNIPPREFLYGSIVGRKYVSMIVAPPGAGKSMFTMQLGLYAAAGMPWGRWQCKKPLNVWLYNNEEGSDELRRRIKGVLLDADIDKAALKGDFYIDSGEQTPINIASLGDEGVIATPDYVALKAEVIARGIDLLIIDPFAETHSVNENSNDEIKRVAGLYRQIAFDANCAVLLVHHTRKGMEGSNGQQAGNADMARGGGATIGVVRRAFTLSTMTESDAESFGVPKEKRRWFVRFDDAKSNISPPADKTDWFQFNSISLGNGAGLYPDGDSIGVLKSVNITDLQAEYADENRAEMDAVLLMVIQQMDTMGWETSSVKELSQCLIGARKTNLKDSSLRKKITEYVKMTPKSHGITFNGNAHFLSISDQKSPNNSVIIRVRKVEI